MGGKVAAQGAVPIGVVWVERAGGTLAQARADFAAIKAAGFSNMKQLLFRTTLAQEPAAAAAYQASVFNAALDEGLVPWWYGVGGWECITLELLASLGIPASTPMAAVQADERMIAHQTGVLRARVARMASAPRITGLGEPGRGSAVVAAAFVPHFAEWLATQYGQNFTRLLIAWQYPWRDVTTTEFGNWTEAALAASAVTLSEPCPWTYCASGVSWDFRRYRDAMRFQADFLYADLARQVDASLAWDPEEPQRTGGQHVLDNYAQNGWDMRAQAALAARAGSLYISLHTPWHYNLMNGEIDRPLFHQAKLAADALRGGWVGEWESTGGPSSYSGGQGAAVDAGTMRRLLLGYLAAGMKGVGLWAWNARDRGQEGAEYALTNLQGGCGSRCAAAAAVARAAEAARWELWSATEAPLVAVLTSWENEALFARLALVGPPLPCSISECHDFTAAMAWDPVKARVGAARVLGDAGLPYAFLDARDVAAGALLRAPEWAGVRVLVLPHLLGLPADALAAVREWQLAGGRVVADAPFFLYDTSVPAGTDGTPPLADGAPLDGWGRIVDQASSASAALFGGAHVVDLQPLNNGFRHYAVCLPPAGEAPAPPGSPEPACAPGNASAGVLPLGRVGRVAELAPGAGTVRAWLAEVDPRPDGAGAVATALPAAVHARAGNGSSALLAFEAFRLAWASDAYPTVHDAYAGAQAAAAAVALDAVTDSGAIRAPWAVTVAPPRATASEGSLSVHRRLAFAADGARVDHVFLINSDPWPVTATFSLDAAAGRYGAATDAVSGATVPVVGGGAGFAIVVPARDARWVRAALL